MIEIWGGSTWLNTSQRITAQIWILKKGWFSEFEILEIGGQENREKHKQVLPTQIETLNIEKQKPLNWPEMQNTGNRNTTDTKEISIHKEKKTTLQSPRKQAWKNVKVENEKCKQITTKYQNVHHHWTKWANLCWSETSQWQNWYSSQEAEQKYKTWMGN